MTEQEAIENFQKENKILSQYAESKFQKEVFARKIERNNMAIKALETMQELKKRNMKIKDLKNYMQFEDECVKKGFTFESLLKARELQIVHKVEEFGLCPDCCYDFGYKAVNHCPNCGQKIDWGEEE